jgi:hypothetical protein
MSNTWLLQVVVVVAEVLILFRHQTSQTQVVVVVLEVLGRQLVFQ